MSYEGSPAGSATPGMGIPQLAACLLIGYLFFRWYNSSPTSNNPGATGSGSSSSPASATSRRPPTAQDLARLNQRAEIVHGMFPQIPLSAIRWELQKNGGSVEITTEKILSQGFLPEPPSAQATPSGSASRSRVSTPATGAVASSSSSSTPKPHSDLITRYNLSDKLVSTSGQVEEEQESRPSGKGSVWSQSKQERQALLQKRKEEMILKARRKMEEKDRAAS